MSKKKYREYGICSYCLGSLETLDESIDFARHIGTETPWKQCPEGMAGKSLLKELIGTSLKIPSESTSDARKRLRNQLERNSD